MVIGYSRRLQWLQELFSEEVAQTGAVIGSQTCHTVHCGFFSVHPPEDLRVELIDHDICASDDGPLAAQVGVVHVWEDGFDGLILAGGDLHQFQLHEVGVRLDRVF